jgi:hypothetical protein
MVSVYIAVVILEFPSEGRFRLKNCEIVYLKQLSPDEAESYENAVALCANECAPLVPAMSSDEIAELLEEKTPLRGYSGIS